MLVNVLSAISVSNPSVGYCQGMNFVVGTMLIARLPDLFANAGQLSDSDDEDHCHDRDHDEDAALNVGNNSPIEKEKRHSSIRTSLSAKTIDAALQLQVEEEVFALVRVLVDRNSKLNLAGLWQERIPKMKLRVYQLDRLLKWYYPRLHSHLVLIR